MRPVVRKTGEVQLGLDIDLFALAFVFFQCCRRAREWQACLRIVRPNASAAHAIGFQPPRNFSSPFGFSGAGRVGIVVRVGRTIKTSRRGHTYSYGLGIIIGLGERCVTERAIFDVLEQEGATMRAYLYHWSVLRCGIPVTEHGYDSTRSEHQIAGAVPQARSVAYQATRAHPRVSD